MKTIISSLTMFLLLGLGPGVIADTRAGQITSRACPFSCATERISRSDCRDWREGDTCYVEDLRHPAPAALPPARKAAECMNLDTDRLRHPAIQITRERAT